MRNVLCCKKLFHPRRSLSCGPDITSLINDIIKEFEKLPPLLRRTASYYFESPGKMIRPSIVMALSKICNHRRGNTSEIAASQIVVAKFIEMIHTASIMHDDIIDTATHRRSKTALHMLFGNKVALMTGNYVMSAASLAICHLRNPMIVKILSNSLHDLVSGELMQLKSYQSLHSQETFDSYIHKSYLKTASLLAHCCKAVAYMSSSENPETYENCFNFGKNIGIAFQLVDDALDYDEDAREKLGKPWSIDLKQGHITAPLIFASQRIPELNEICQRKFSQPSDVERAVGLVKEGGGVNETLSLAEKYTETAMSHLESLGWTPYTASLRQTCEFVISRKV